jgi:hypothetical protein
MFKFQPHLIAGMFEIFGKMVQLMQTHNPKEKAPDDTKKNFSAMLSGLKRLCQETRLEYSVTQIERVIEKLSEPNFTVNDWRGGIEELRNRMFDELSKQTCMIVPPQKALEYYEKSNIFGDQVFNKFPAANFDIEEAGKCFATSRNTACVMHLMRVMEVGRNALASAEGIPTASANWQFIIDQINSKISQAKANKTTDWLEKESFYSEVVANLFAVKVAWRNPSMHVEKTYDEETAKEILGAVRGFMRKLAQHLDEIGNFTP